MVTFRKRRKILGLCTAALLGLILYMSSMSARAPRAVHETKAPAMRVNPFSGVFPQNLLLSDDDLELDDVSLKRFRDPDSGRDSVGTAKMTKLRHGWQDTPDGVAPPLWGSPGYTEESIVCHTIHCGRLGNSLFEYVSLLGIARQANKTPVITNPEVFKGALRTPPPSGAGLGDKTVIRDRCGNATLVKEVKGGRFKRGMLDLRPGVDYYIHGCFQSWMYFFRIWHEAKDAVAFNDDIVGKATKVVSKLRRLFADTVIVGVHVRREDLATPFRKRQGFVLAPATYFINAMSYFRQRHARVVFIVVGQDPQWSLDNLTPAKSTAAADAIRTSVVNTNGTGRAVTPANRTKRYVIKSGVNKSTVTKMHIHKDKARRRVAQVATTTFNDVIVLEPSSPEVDMQVLSMFDHLIASQGTFSWFAGFKMAGKGRVVYNKDNIARKGSPLEKWYSEDLEDYVLPHWVEI